MTLSRSLFSVVLIVLGAVVAVMVNSQSAAQVVGGNASGRYQIAAWGGATQNGPHHGCYILDTQTGQVWHTSAESGIRKVSDKLP